MKARAALVLVGWLAFVARVHAQPHPDDAKGQALAHFETGVARARAKDYAQALIEFEAAFRLRPHHSVLYNIGQTRLALGHIVEAVAALDHYLASAGEQVTPERRAEIQAVFAAHRARYSRLRVELEDPEGTRVWLDGVELKADQLGAPVVVASGAHHVLFAYASGLPQVRRVELTGGELAELRLPRALPPELPQPVALAQLSVSCAIPDVEIDVGGRRRGKTPLKAPLLVPVGQVEVHFSRSGYRSSSKQVTLEREGVASVSCDLEIEPRAPAASRGSIIIRSVPDDAVVTVDGRRFASGTLPIGRHVLRLERDGYVAIERQVIVPAGRSVAIAEVLQLTPAAKERGSSVARQRQRIGLVVGISGAVVIGAGAGLYAWSSRRHRDFEANRGSSISAADLERASSIQRMDDAAIGLALLGAGLAAAGAILYF